MPTNITFTYLGDKLIEKNVSLKNQDKPKRSIVFWFIIVFTVLVFSALSLFPVAIKVMAEKWLQNNGATSAHIQDVDFNVFSGQFRLLNLKASDAKNRTLHFSWVKIYFDWSSLIDRKVVINQIEMSHTQLDVHRDKEQVYIGPLSFSLAKISSMLSSESNRETPASQAPPSTLSWNFGLNFLNLNRISVNYKDAKLNQNFYINSIEVHDIQTWDPNKALTMSADISVGKGKLQLQSKLKPFRQPMKIISDIALTQLDLSPYKIFLAETGMQDFSGILSLKAHVNATQAKNNGVVIASEGEIHIEKINFAHEVLHSANVLDFLWKGKASTVIRPETDELVVNSDGTASLQGLTILTAAHEVKLKQLLWRGEASFNKAEKQKNDPISLLANTELHGLLITQLDPLLHVLEVAVVSFEQLQLRSIDDIVLAKLALNNIMLLTTVSDAPKSVLTLQRVIAEQLTLQQSNHLSINNITVRDLKAWLSINSEGDVKIVRLLNKTDGTGRATTSIVTDTTKPLDTAPPDASLILNVSQFVFIGNNKLMFKDASITPVYEDVFKNVTLHLPPIKSTPINRLPNILKNNIDFKFPVKGSLEHPKGNINHLINKALAR